MREKGSLSLLLLAIKTTRNACKATEEDFRHLKQKGGTEEKIFEDVWPPCSTT